MGVKISNKVHLICNMSSLSICRIILQKGGFQIEISEIGEMKILHQSLINKAFHMYILTGKG